MRSPLWASSQWSPLSAVSPPTNKICPSQCSLHGESACAYCRGRLLPFLIARSASLFRHLSQSQSFLICSNSRQQVRKLTELQKSTSRLVAAQKNLAGMSSPVIRAFRLVQHSRKLTPTPAWITAVPTATCTGLQSMVHGCTKEASISAEYGWNLRFNDFASVEPQVELTYGTVMGVDLTASNDVKIEQYDVDRFIGRIGVRGGFLFPNNKGTVYARASAVHDFDGDTDFKASKTTSPIRAKRNGSIWAESDFWGISCMGKPYNQEVQQRNFNAILRFGPEHAFSVFFTQAA